MCASARNIRADARIYSRSGYAPGVPRRAEGPRLDAWAALLHVHADVVPLLDRALQETRGLPLRWYDVLLELANAPGSRLRMQELGERAVLSRTRVSRVVDELVDAGLVCREPDSEDRRISMPSMSISADTSVTARPTRCAQPFGGFSTSAVDSRHARAVLESGPRPWVSRLANGRVDIHPSGPRKPTTSAPRIHLTSPGRTTTHLLGEPVTPPSQPQSR
jgi:DNA-binding transcriptional ArsR family regulator